MWFSKFSVGVFLLVLFVVFVNLGDIVDSPIIDEIVQFVICFIAGWQVGGWIGWVVNRVE